MRTSRGFSAVSYNTCYFLENKLKDLTNHDVLAFWMYIEHKAESDDKSEHKHVYMIPDCRIDTQALSTEFIQSVQGEQLPRRLIVGRNCKFLETYLYFLHDKKFLESRGLERKYHYSKDMLICSDDTMLHEFLITADYSKVQKKCPSSMIIEAIEDGQTWLQFVCNGNVPTQQYAGYRKMWQDIEAYYRVINKETGEIGYKK